jgi:hypothetical protein
MKKFIYTVLLAITVSLSFYSCTEEVIKPKDAAPSGTAITPIIR